MKQSGNGATSSVRFYAAQLRKRRARFGTKWHLDEVFIKMNRVQHYLWRAVDQNGVVIDILVQPRRDRWAALRFFRKLLHTAHHRQTTELRRSKEVDLV